MTRTRPDQRWNTRAVVVVWVLFALLTSILWIRTELDRRATADDFGRSVAAALSGDAEAFFADRVKWQQDLAADELAAVTDDETFAEAMRGARTPFALLLDGDARIIATFPTRTDILPGDDMSGRFSHIDGAKEGRVGYWTLDAGARTETGTIIAIATPFTGIDGDRILTTAFELGSVDLPASLRTTVVRLVPNGLVGIVDDNGVLLSGESIGDVTDSAERILGSGMTPDDVLQAIGSPEGWRYESAGDERVAYTTELGDGSIHLVASFASRDLLDAVGGPPTNMRVALPLALIVLAVALRQRKLEEDDRLAQERAFFSGLVPMITTFEDGTIRRVNTGAQRLLGRAEAELAGHPIGSIRPPADDDQPLVVRHGSKHRLVVERGDGSAFAASLESADLPNAHPDGSVMVHSITDESESLASQARIAAQSSEWRALVDHSPLPFALVDRSGYITRVNEALERLTQRGRAELVGMRAIDVLSYGLDNGPLARLLDSVEPQTAKSTEHQVTRADGSVRDVRGFAIGIGERTSVDARTMLQLIDVTETNRLTRELERSREALEQFASRAAHDLKSPLSTIAGFAALIEEGGIDEATLTDAIGRMKRSATKASDQVQSLLEYAMRVAEAERVEVDLRQTRSWLEDLLATELMATSGSIDLDTDIDFVLTEEVPLRQVLQNICSNSIKYARETVPPRVVIRASREGGNARIVVEDNGIGVPEDRLRTIFDEGYQEDHTSSGVGMGLPTVRALVGDLGGRIHAEQNHPHGLRLVISIPGQDIGTEEVTVGTEGAPVPRPSA